MWAPGAVLIPRMAAWEQGGRSTGRSRCAWCWARLHTTLRSSILVGAEPWHRCLVSWAEVLVFRTFAGAICRSAERPIALLLSCRLCVLPVSLLLPLVQEGCKRKIEMEMSAVWGRPCLGSAPAAGMLVARSRAPRCWWSRALGFLCLCMSRSAWLACLKPFQPSLQPSANPVCCCSLLSGDAA